MSEVVRALFRLPPPLRDRVIGELPVGMRRELAERWTLHAHGGQIAPPGDWRVWLIRAGRGFGKTRAGAEWVTGVAAALPCARIALIGASIDEARRIMVEGPFAQGAERAGRAVETALVRAAQRGKIGFDELRALALAVMADIAAAAIRAGISAAIGGSVGGGSAGSGLSGLFGSGAPGRATGGPVSPDRPYWVGERGPELFVPTTSGHVAAATQSGPREVRVAISVNAPAGEAAAALQRSSRQVARAVRQALMEAG